MGVFTYEHEFNSSIAPARLFKAFVRGTDTIYPKVAPHVVKHVETIEGDRGPGTINKTTFGEAPSQIKVSSEFNLQVTDSAGVEHRIDSIDHDNLTYFYGFIGGDVLPDELEKVSHETKLAASPDGGSIIKATGKYYHKGDHEIREEILMEGKERNSAKFKRLQLTESAELFAY